MTQYSFYSTILAAFVVANSATADLPGIRVADERYAVSLIDSDEKIFFVSHATDLSGRLFVGAREGLFVYEPEGNGFGPRQELYRFPAHSWLYDLEVYGNDLLVLCNTALYRIRGAVTKREGLKPEKLLWGLPQGHYHQGMHGMEFGPTGDLFLSMGDPQPHMHWDRSRPDHLWHWTFFVGPENKEVPYTGVGAVLRYSLEDNTLTVHASGLRNSCGISFDPQWRLFANDNDQEGAVASPGKLVYAPRHSWHGWVRGWAARHNPARRDMLPVTNLELDVPVGQCWHEGAVLVANWGNRTVSRHRVVKKGAGFIAPRDVFLECEGPRRPVSVMPLNDSRFVVAVCYMQGNEGSPVRKTDLLMLTPKTPNPDEPWALRYRKHQEILRRGGADLAQAAQRFLHTSPKDPNFNSLIYLAGVHGDASSLERIQSLAGAGEEQAIRVMAEFPAKFARLNVAPLLAEPELRHAVLEYLRAAPQEDLPIELAADEDAFVRQSAAQLLARRASASELADWAADNSEKIRQAAVNAAGFSIWNAIKSTKNFPERREMAGPAQIAFEHPNGPIKLQKPVFIFMPSEWWRDASNRESVSEHHAILTRALSDPSPRVRIPAAVQLFFLKDTEVDEQVLAVLEKAGIELAAKSKASENAAAQKRALRALKSATLASNEKIAAEFANQDWNSGGDAKLGKKLFTERACVACHLAPDDRKGGSIGPSLVNVHKRFSAQYLAESILLPNRFVSPNFYPTTLITEDGKVLTGFVEKDGETVELRLITAKLISLAADEIEERAPSQQSMMPVGLVKTPDEMRHLLAYMLKRDASFVSKATRKRPEDKRFRPGEPNEYHFDPIEAQFVRVELLGGSRVQPCIDEIEIFASGSTKNLALAGKASASSLLPGFERKHQIVFLNDGKYGNPRSWIPATKTGWAQIELAKSATIHRVVLSRDREKKLHDRSLVDFDIRVSVDGKTWKTVNRVRAGKVIARILRRD